MRLHRLAVQGLRNLQSPEIQLHPRVNLFHGANASGKTSLLEAVHLLSCGRSFRCASLQRVVQQGAGGFTLFAQLEDEGGHRPTLGIEFRERRLRLRSDGQALHRTAELAAIMPVIVLHQESHRLISEGPKWRRRYLDWGLFHVEQSFYPLWRRYMRALKQRNRALQQRAATRDVHVWEGELVETGEAIHQLRRRFLGDLGGHFRHYLHQLLPDLASMALGYESGWPPGQGLEEALGEGLAQDRALGYTRRGPHRADLVLTVDGIAARERVSRGQQKLLVCALHLAQAAAYRQRCDRSCILLVDDVAAELDRRHRDRILELLQELDIQVLLTATEPLASLDQALIQQRFHVEHGHIQASH